jgi:hypothetical protein
MCPIWDPHLVPAHTSMFSPQRSPALPNYTDVLWRCITAMIGMQLLGLMINFSCRLLVTELVDIGCQIRDRDRSSVRDNLPVAVGILDKAITEKAKGPGETVYLHCCRGLGRSPSVAVAYLYWFTGLNVSFRFSTCIYAPCKCLSSADLFILVLQLLILSLVFLYVI